ncbi:unnamed protein product [Nezara viridula]|uniref:Vacuolar protein sorting-associated protein 13A n=1 Tax=Nezara viridula TaxID=85310 RepID=A0A9P0E899_NEZVI|nr:unnamed protein product [Nezara viridula]
MFERVVATLLHRYLGKYIQDLDTENLNVGIFGGDVQLSDLKIKPDALYELDLPIEVKVGTIGRINIKIPWGCFNKQSVAIEMEDVYVIVAPITDREYDPEKEKRLIRASKRRKLELLEIGHFLGTDAPESSSFVENLITTIMNNLQVFIHNIHVRYEDSKLNSDSLFACGLCLQSLSIETTNSKWKPTTSQQGLSSVYQMVKVESLSIYCNPGCSQLVGKAPGQDSAAPYTWRSDMKRGLETFSVKGEEFEFTKMKLIVNKSNEARVPKLLVDFVLQDAATQLSRQQYLVLIDLMDSFKRININRKYRQYHPNKSVNGNVAEWWKYLYNGVLEQRLLKEEPERVKAYEKGGIWWKKGADSEPHPELHVTAGTGRGIWAQLSPSEKTMLCDAIGYNEAASGEIEKPKQYIEHKVNFTLANCSLSLLNRGHEVMVLTLAQFLASLETRPSAKAFKLSGRVESFVIEGISLEHDLVPIITADNIYTELMSFVQTATESLSQICYSVTDSCLSGIKSVSAKAIRRCSAMELNIDLKLPYIVLPELGTLQKHKLNVTLSSIKFNISDRKIGSVMDFLDNIPLPSPNTVHVSISSNVVYLASIPELTNDEFRGDPTVDLLTRIKILIVESELKKQNKIELSNIDKAGAKMAMLQVDKNFISSEVSDEENEQWARTVDLPGFDDNVSPNNIINMLLRFMIGEIVVQLCRSCNRIDKPYLMLRIAKICCDAALMEYGPAIQATLGSVQLVDKLHTGNSGEYLELISTDPSADVASLLYRKVRSDCPDFKSHFHSVEQSLVLDFTRASVILHREAFVTLNKYLQYLLQKVQSREIVLCHKIFGKWTIEPLNEIWEKQNDPPIPPGATKFSYSTRLQELKLKFCDTEMEFLEIKIGGLESDCLFKANERMVLRFYLARITIDDLSDMTLYPKILSVEDEKVLDMKYVRHSPRFYKNPDIDTKKDDVKSDGTLKIHVGRIQLVFFCKMILDFQQFMEPFVRPALIPTLIFNLEKYCLEKFSSLRSCSTRIHLAIDIRTPSFLFPQKISSPNLIIFCLGDLSVENFFKEKSSPVENVPAPVIDNILIRLENIQICRAVMTLAGSLEIQEPIVDPLSVKFDVKRAVDYHSTVRALTGIYVQPTSQLLLYQIIGNIDNIRINLGQRDLSTILNVWVDNFNQGIFIGEVTNNWTTPSSPIEAHTPVPPAEDQAVKKLQAFFFQNEPVRREGSVRILQSHTGSTQVEDSNISVSTPPIIDVTFRQTQTGDKCVDVLVEALRLSLSISFVLDLSRFILDSLPPDRIYEGGLVNHGYVGDSNIPMKPSIDTVRPPSSADSTSGYFSLKASCMDEQTGISISVQIRRPEIMLYSSSGHALLLRTEVLADYSRHPGRESFVFSLSGLRLLCKHQVPHKDQHPYIVLHPCDIEFAKSQKMNDDGLKMTLGVGLIDIHITPNTVHAITALLEEVNTNLMPEEPDGSNVLYGSIETDDLWSPKKISPYTFPHQSSYCCGTIGRMNEIFTAAIPKLRIIFELEDSNKRVPMVLLKAATEASVHNWSKYLQMKGELQVQISYYNSKVGAWEPLLEPCVEEEGVYRPYEILFKVFRAKAYPIQPCMSCDESNEREMSSSLSKLSQSKSLSRVANSEESETSADEQDVETGSMMFIRKKQLRNDHKKSKHESISLISYPEDSDSDNEEGVMEKLASAISHLFTGDSSDGEASDSNDSSGAEPSADTDDNTDVESLTSAHHPPSGKESRAIFLKKQSDSVDSGLETEGVDKVATYVMIESRDRLELSVTPQSIAVLTSLHQAFTLSAPIPMENELSLINDIAPSSTITLLSKAEVGPPKVLMTSTYERSDSMPSSPASTPPTDFFSPLGSEGDPDYLEDGFYSRKTDPEVSSELYSPYMKFPVEPVSCLYKKITDQRVRIHIPGFEEMEVLCPQRTCNKLHFLQPIKNNTRYYIVLNVECHDWGQKITVRSPLQVKNETSYAIAIYYKKAVLETLGYTVIGESTNPFEDMFRIAVIEPDEVFNVPLTVAHHCKLYVQPAYVDNYSICDTGLWWQDLASDLNTPKDIVCSAKEESEPTVFSVRAFCEEGSPIWRPSRLIPKYLIRLLPPLAFHNRLPYAIEVKVPSIKYEVRIEAGEKASIYFLNLLRTHKISIHGGRGEGGRGEGKGRGKSGRVGGGRGGGKIRREGGAGGREGERGGQNEGRLRMRGTTYFILLDRERKRRYRILLKVDLSEVCPHLTKIVTLLPNFIVSNECKRPLRFMEENEKADLWIDLSPTQTLAFWPETEKMNMFVKFRDSKVVSQHFPITSNHDTVLRMDKGVALLSPYQSLLYTWDDPCKERTLLWNVYNKKSKDFMSEIWKDGYGQERVSFHMVRKQGSAPTSSQPPTVTAKLSASLKRLSTPLQSGQSSSSEDSESDELQKPQLSKKTRKDKVVVYWVSYLEGPQRVLMFTQDERIAYKARLRIDSEKSNVEFFLSLKGIGLSLEGDFSLEDEDGHVRTSSLDDDVLRTLVEKTPEQLFENLQRNLILVDQPSMTI